MMVREPQAALPDSSASGMRSKKATPITAPALNPKTRCRRSRREIANIPPTIVAANAAQAIAMTSMLVDMVRLLLLVKGQPCPENAGDAQHWPSPPKCQHYAESRQLTDRWCQISRPQLWR